jgi:hypothetical protein
LVILDPHVKAHIYIYTTMTYDKFIQVCGGELQLQTTTNIRWSRESMRWLLILRYVLDTYYNSVELECLRFENRVKILNLLRCISKQLGACNLTLDRKFY